ncbi:MAG TPA: hypothetical protein P5239_02955 [Victivallales bacterium]|nr:hypothetical protein [Victivallales bacterium]
MFFLSDFSRDFVDGSTVQVRQAGDFPSVICPGQRVAVFLYDIEVGKHLLVRAKFAEFDRKNSASSTRFELYFNGNFLSAEGNRPGDSELEFFIPCVFLEKNANVFELRNNGLEPIKFKLFSIEYFDFETTPILKDFPILKSSLPSLREELLNIDAVHQRKMARYIPHEVAEIASNGKSFDIGAVLKSELLFDPVSGAATMPWFYLRAASIIFDGEPRLLPVLISSETRGRILSASSTASVAVYNADGVVSVLISSVRDSGEGVKISVPIPWSAKTKCRISRGVVPADLTSVYSGEELLKIEEKIIEITNGIFETSLKLSNCITIRLIKDGASEPSPAITELPPKKARAVFQKGILRCDMKRGDISAPFRIAIRGSDRASGVLSPNYAIMKSDATKSDIAGVKGIVPFDGKSDIVEISYSDGKIFPSEGANIFYNKIPENYDELSFWIYPRIFTGRKGKAAKRTTLQIYFKDTDNKKHFLALDLELEKWQRVILPSKVLNLASSGRICIVGDPKLPEYRDGAKVSFELNGFCVVGDSHPRYGKAALKSTRIISDKKGIKFILTGEPRKYFEYRHLFAEPVEISAISELSGVKSLKYVYKKDAQILEISGTFPSSNQVAEEITTSINSSKMPEDTFSLSLEARKFCNSVELSSYEKGTTIPIVIHCKYKTEVD